MGYSFAMARCGRCGLWAEYPNNFEEKKWAGVCLWYQFRLPEDEVWEHRKCQQFFERMPQWDALQHWNYALRHHDIGRGWKAGRRSLIFSLAAMAISIFGLVLKMI